MSRGGYRPNAGRKKRPLAEKIEDGNPGKRPLTVLKFAHGLALSDGAPPDLPKYLEQHGRECDEMLPSAQVLYDSINDLVARSGCADKISQHLIHDFVHLRRSYLEAEWAARKYGRAFSMVDKDGNKIGKRNPYVSIALDYQKAADVSYQRIWAIISQNCETKLENSGNAFLTLLAGRGF
jgi:hypothetical protein